MADKIYALFLDIGGVLLTNGWDRHARSSAIKKFNLDEEEVQERHHLTFDTYESGKLSLDQYLDRVVFFKERNFSKDDFRDFMFSNSKPFPDMINYIKDLKKKYNLRIFAVSNEGRELNDYRIKTFKLYEVFDGFISSSFVHFRKPDEDIFKVALDISQIPPENIVYLDDRDMFVEIAKSMGIKGIHHENLDRTKKMFEEFGLTL